MLRILIISFLYFSIATDAMRCKPEYSFSFAAGGWLKLHTTPLTWEEAFVRCHDEGAVLASPLSKYLADALRMKMSQIAVNGNIFLGTHDLYAQGEYVSVEGVPLSDMDIKWGNRASSGDCLTMSVDGRAYYSSCNDPLPFVCYRKLNNDTINECGTLDNEYHLNQQTGSCYKVHHEKLSWTRAYKICASEGGHLVVLNDEVEANIVKGMFAPRTENSDPWEQLHVGLVAWGKDRVWTTIHGDRIEDVYNKWNIEQPNNLHGNQNRGALIWNGNLDDVNEAEVNFMFVCEKSPQTKPFEDLPPCQRN